MLEEFDNRHHELKEFFLQRYEQLKPLILTKKAPSIERQLLIGAYFSQEYAVEGAALFNPSLVWHPDQSGVPEGSRRFVLSLRATGEGHLSSITFRVGVLDKQNQIALDPPTRFVSRPESVSYPRYERSLMEHKLRELDHWDELVASVLFSLNDTFTLDDLKSACQTVERQSQERRRRASVPLRSLMTLARANYKVAFSPQRPLSERILFPTSPAEINGMEDARFVAFQGENEKTTYYATYTAYDGKMTMPQLLKTEDFIHFEMSTLNGFEVQNKGMALFPRKIQGRYAMLSRQDNENIYLMFSDNLRFWYYKELLLKPVYPWECVQLGNCGSPLEIDAGWLVLTHGVGPMRRYAIGAVLLDKDNPLRVLGRLREPLLVPDTNEREGYVPNVVYSCGAQIHNNELILPYATSDCASSFAIVPIDDILSAME